MPWRIGGLYRGGSQMPDATLFAGKVPHECVVAALPWPTTLSRMDNRLPPRPADEAPASPAEHLLPQVYHELRRLAAARLENEAHEFTLQATALVHEAWIKLAGAEKQEWSSRAHFFGAAAETMRRILIDRARRRNRVRHGGDLQRVDLDSVDIADAAPDEVLLQMDDALQMLAAESPVKAELVKLRFYMGLHIDEAAEILGISPATAKRHWTYARAWLFAKMREAE